MLPGTPIAESNPMQIQGKDLVLPPPILFDLKSKDGPQKLVKNIGQMVRENNRHDKTSFVLLQSVPEENPARESFIESLKEVLKDTGWKMAKKRERSDDTDGVMTLFNSAYFQQIENPQITLDKELLKNNTEQRSIAAFQIKTRDPNPSQIAIANVIYKDDVDNDIIQQNFNDVRTAYETEIKSSFLMAGKMKSLGELPFAAGSSGSNYPKKNGDYAFIVPPQLADNIDSAKLADRPEYNQTDAAVYEQKPKAWRFQDIDAVLEQNFASITSKEKTTHAVENQKSLSLFHPTMEVNAFNAKQSLGLDIVNFLHLHTPDKGWNETNLPETLRIVVPLYSEDTKQYTTLAFTLKVDKKALLATLAKVAWYEKHKATLNAAKIKQYSITHSDVSKCFALENGKDYQYGIKEAFANNAVVDSFKKMFPKQAIAFKRKLPMLAVDDDQKLSTKNSAPIATAQAQHFLDGNDKPIKAAAEGDESVLKNWDATDVNKWEKDKKRLYANQVNSLVWQQQRQQQPVLQQADKDEENPDEDNSKSNSKKNRAATWNAQQKNIKALNSDYKPQRQSILDRNNWKENNNEIIERDCNGKEYTVLKISNSGGGTEITNHRKTDPDAIELMLLTHLKNGFNLQKDTLILSTNFPGLYVVTLEKLGFDLEKVKFEPAKAVSKEQQHSIPSSLGM